MKRFMALWTSQVLSGTGSLLTSFSIGIWVFQQNSSVMDYALVLFFATVPSLLLSPVTGAFIDRSSRKKLLIGSDAGAAITNLVLISCLLNFEVSLPIIFLFLTISSTFNNFQWPAYSSWVTVLIEEKDYGRAGGWLKLGEGIPYLVAPLAGGAVYGKWGLEAVIAIDLATFLLSMLIVLSISESGQPKPRKGAWTTKGLIKETRIGCLFLWKNPGLFLLLLITPLVVFSETWVVAVFQPYLMLFLSPAGLGAVLTIGGAGMAIGGITMGIWGGPKRQVHNVIGFVFLQAIIVGVLALFPFGFLGVGAVAFLYFLCIPFLSGSNQAIWQKKVPFELQGRVFSIRKSVESIAAPAAFLAAGALSQPLTQWFSRIVLPQLPSALAPERWQGRELGLTFLLPCVFTIGVIFIAALIPNFRRVEDIEIKQPILTGDESSPNDDRASGKKELQTALNGLRSGKNPGKTIVTFDPGSENL